MEAFHQYERLFSTVSNAAAQELVGSYTANEVLELQGRACEYGRTFRHETIRSQLFEHMPALDEATYSRWDGTPIPRRSRNHSASCGWS